MNKEKFKKWIKAAGIRALKTVAQTACHYWHFRYSVRSKLGGGLLGGSLGGSPVPPHLGCGSPGSQR